MKLNRMYDDFAHLWFLITPPEDYAEEAQHWRDALREKLGPGRHEILELGVGGGNNLSHLTNDFQATAVDLSEKMLQNSMKLNPGVEHHVGDMRNIRLEKTFKAVLIHDAIGYMLTEDDLRDVSGLVNYDAIVFPYLANVSSASLTQIEFALYEAVWKYGIGRYLNCFIPPDYVLRSYWDSTCPILINMKKYLK